MKYTVLSIIVLITIFILDANSITVPPVAYAFAWIYGVLSLLLEVGIIYGGTHHDED